MDCGSMKTHILTKTAESLGLIPVGTLTVNHQLFGGKGVLNVLHQVYDVNFCATDGSFTKSVRVLDEKKICGIVSRVPKGAVMAELQEKGIEISDSSADDSLEIEILIGGDILGRYLTGRVVQLQSGLTATGTQFGWTVMGLIRSQIHLNNLAMP